MPAPGLIAGDTAEPTRETDDEAKRRVRSDLIACLLKRCDPAEAERRVDRWLKRSRPNLHVQTNDRSMETTFDKLEVGAEFRKFGELEPSPNYSEEHKGVKLKTSTNSYRIVESDCHPIYEFMTHELGKKSLGVKVVKIESRKD